MNVLYKINKEYKIPLFLDFRHVYVTLASRRPIYYYFGILGSRCYSLIKPRASPKSRRIRIKRDGSGYQSLLDTLGSRTRDRLFACGVPHTGCRSDSRLPPKEVSVGEGHARSSSKENHPIRVSRTMWITSSRSVREGRSDGTAVVRRG